MKNESETVKDPVKTVVGPKAAVATFIRPRDNKRIFVYTRRSEGVEDAIKRVMKSNGAEGGHYDKCN